VRERIGGRRGPQGMDREAIHLGADAGLAAVFQDGCCDRPNRDRAGSRSPVRLFLTGRNTGPAASAPWPAMARYSSISRCAITWNEPDFAALAPDPKMHLALTALHVPDPQPAQSLAAQAVIKQGGQDGAIARALEGVAGRRLRTWAPGRRPAPAYYLRCRSLLTASRRRRDCWTRRRARRGNLTGRTGPRLPADAGWRQTAGLEVLAPGGRGPRCAAPRARAGKALN
jgi:hypothetical protein